MARIWTCGFESKSWYTDGFNADFTKSNDGTVTYDASTVRVAGTRASLKCDGGATPGTAYGLYTYTTTNGRYYYLRTYISLSSAIGQNNINIIRINDTGGVTQIALRLNASNQLRLYNYNTSGNVGPASLSLTAGTWYRVEIGFMNSGSGTNNSYVEFRLDDYPVVSSATETFGTAAIGRYTFGWYTAPTTNQQIWFDDCALNDNQTGGDQTSWPGDGRVWLILPTSDNAIGNFLDDNAGTSNLYDALNNTPPVGVAHAPSTMAATAQIYNVTSGTGQNSDYNVQTYTAVGISANETIVLAQLGVAWANGTGTTGRNMVAYILSNPAESNLGNVSVATQTAVFPSGWTYTLRTLLYAPSVVRGTVPVVRLQKNVNSTNAMSICFAGITVESRPPVAARNGAGRTNVSELLTYQKSLTSVTAAIKASGIIRPLTDITASVAVAVTTYIRSLTSVSIAVQATGLTRPLTAITAATKQVGITRSITSVTVAISEHVSQDVSSIHVLLSQLVTKQGAGRAKVTEITTVQKTISGVTAALLATNTHSLTSVSAAIKASGVTRSLQSVTAAVTAAGTYTRTMTNVSVAVKQLGITRSLVSVSTTVKQSGITRSLTAVSVAVKQQGIARSITSVTATVKQQNVARSLTSVSTAVKATNTRSITAVTAAIKQLGISRSLTTVSAAVQATGTYTRELTNVSAAVKQLGIIRSLVSVSVATKQPNITRPITSVTAVTAVRHTRTIATVSVVVKQSGITRSLTTISAAVKQVSITRSLISITTAVKQQNIPRNLTSVSTAVKAVGVARNLTGVSTAVKQANITRSITAISAVVEARTVRSFAGRTRLIVQGTIVRSMAGRIGFKVRSKRSAGGRLCIVVSVIDVIFTIPENTIEWDAAENTTITKVSSNSAEWFL